ncbi:MAG: Ribosomal large subunit pseudouridine synthase B [Chroococcopsis gigantea SAG 12.99]|jgi:pseudouridine synthase|nr:rRNA pseudouridine synthase [Chlorogloea purpurea SAG 13.99]MDV3001907.1 Ribosomal large subunit pseudouridine synthase B [Chroococcopsis gigantea SAG 12.99]
MADRLQKILSGWGIASRREAEEMIREGRVKVNGITAVLGDRAEPSNDCIEVDGDRVNPCDRPPSLCILLHKPQGVISSCFDPQGRPTVLDLLPSNLARGQGLHPVGRLDFNSTGALLVTNDGDITLGFTHPRYHVPKTYQVWIEGKPADNMLQEWRKGVMLMGKSTLPAQVRVMEQTPHKTLLEVILMEGRNRQIRRVVQQLGHQVLKLHRSAIGLIELHPENETPLPAGNYRSLTAKEVNFIQKQVNLVTGK